MNFKTFVTSEKNDYKVVEIVEKRVYLTVTEILKEELVSFIEQGNNKLIIDLNRVVVMNSAGLGVLILVRDMMQKRGGVVKLVNLQPLLADIFNRMKLNILFEVFDSIETALAAE
jgi:anti-sigma B factor antagonist